MTSVIWPALIMSFFHEEHKIPYQRTNMSPSMSDSNVQCCTVLKQVINGLEDTALSSEVSSLHSVISATTPASV